MVTWLGCSTGGPDIFVPPLSWLTPDLSTRAAGRGGVEEWKVLDPQLTSSFSRVPLPALPSAVCFAPSVCALQAPPLGLQTWLLGKKQCLCCCQFQGLWGFLKFRLDLFLALFAESDCFFCLWSQLSLNRLLPSIQICFTVVFSWPVVFFFFCFK